VTQVIQEVPTPVHRQIQEAIRLRTPGVTTPEPVLKRSVQLPVLQVIAMTVSLLENVLPTVLVDTAIWSANQVRNAIMVVVEEPVRSPVQAILPVI
jgi:hypothetical protein